MVDNLLPTVPTHAHLCNNWDYEARPRTLLEFRIKRPRNWLSLRIAKEMVREKEPKPRRKASKFDQSEDHPNTHQVSVKPASLAEPEELDEAR